MSHRNHLHPAWSGPQTSRDVVPLSRDRSVAASALEPSTVSTYLSLAAAGDVTEARRLVLDLLDRGVPFADVVTDVLAHAQAEVGRRWQENAWTVADEHLISGVTQRCLDAVASVPEPLVGTARVAVTCAEGDWHSLPAQMFGELLRERGVGVADLGASTPAAHVAQFLERRKLDALVITCTLPRHFAGVTRLASVAHARGVPVLAGGRALAGRRGRAAALGADAWAENVDDVVRIVESWSRGENTPAVRQIDLDSAPLRLHAAAHQVAAAALITLQRRLRVLSAEELGQRSCTVEDLVHVTEITAAARLANDPTVLDELVHPSKEPAGTDGLSRRALRSGCEALAPLVARVDPQAARLLLENALGCERFQPGADDRGSPAGEPAATERVDLHVAEG